MNGRQATGGHLRVGSDLVYVPDVRASIETFGSRYLRRVYTDRELATCTSGDGWSADRLAARFAAKEAAIKVLRPKEGVSYRDVEIVLAADGAPQVRFTGGVARQAGAIDLDRASLSMSHDGEYAMAVFVAATDGD